MILKVALTDVMLVDATVDLMGHWTVEEMADKLVDLKDRSSVALMEEMLVDATDFQMV